VSDRAPRVTLLKVDGLPDGAIEVSIGGSPLPVVPKGEPARKVLTTLFMSLCAAGSTPGDQLALLDMAERQMIAAVEKCQTRKGRK
jgi:hypothetical protein